MNDTIDLSIFAILENKKTYTSKLVIIIVTYQPMISFFRKIRKKMADDNNQ